MATPSKKVSWAPETHLRQVRFFFFEDVPASFVPHSRNQVHHMKSSLPYKSTKMDSVAYVSDSSRSIFQGKSLKSKHPAITWKQPPKFILNPDWFVAEGGESIEIKVQNARQIRIPQVPYISPSSFIPRDPTIASDVENSFYDDAQTPQIPVVEIENEELKSSALEDPYNTLDASTSGLQNNLYGNNQESVKVSTQSTENAFSEKSILKMVPDAEPDVVAAASVVFTAILKSSGKGNLVDRELLVKILSDPTMIEKLSAESGPPKTTPQPASSTVLAPSVAGIPPSPDVVLLPISGVAMASAPSSVKVIDNTKFPHALVQQSTTFSNQSPSSMLPFETQVSSINMHQKSKTIAETPSKDLSYYKSLIREHGSKDANYYKSLIQEHGGDKCCFTDRDVPCYTEFQSHFVKQSFRPCDRKSRFQKPCAFFGSAKGCKRGVNCLFQHDYPLSFPSDGPNEKRVKLDKRIMENS